MRSTLPWNFGPPTKSWAPNQMRQFGKHTGTELSEAEHSWGIQVNRRHNRTAACQSWQLTCFSFFSTFLFSFPPQNRKKRKRKIMAELKLGGKTSLKSSSMTHVSFRLPSVRLHHLTWPFLGLLSKCHTTPRVSYICSLFTETQHTW